MFADLIHKDANLKKFLEHQKALLDMCGKDKNLKGKMITTTLFLNNYNIRIHHDAITGTFYIKQNDMIYLCDLIGLLNTYKDGTVLFPIHKEDIPFTKKVHFLEGIYAVYKMAELCMHTTDPNEEYLDMFNNTMNFSSKSIIKFLSVIFYYISEYMFTMEDEYVKNPTFFRA